jgi:hypothetical protein
MATREERIIALEAKIENCERMRKGFSEDPKDRESYVELTKEIAIDKQERLLLMGQQGKFASPISVVLSHSYR